MSKIYIRPFGIDELFFFGTTIKQKRKRKGARSCFAITSKDSMTGFARFKPYTLQRISIVYLHVTTNNKLNDSVSLIFCLELKKLGNMES